MLPLPLLLRRKQPLLLLPLLPLLRRKQPMLLLPLLLRRKRPMLPLPLLLLLLLLLRRKQPMLLLRLLPPPPLRRQKKWLQRLQRLRRLWRPRSKRLKQHPSILRRWMQRMPRKVCPQNLWCRLLHRRARPQLLYGLQNGDSESMRRLWRRKAIMTWTNWRRWH